MQKLKVLDLFSGIGGFSLGLERTGGFETVAFCEIDPFCRAVLRKHWPDVPIHEDVRELTVEQVGTVDVICGGFPCQDLSFAGKGAGLAGERSGLWSEIRRLSSESQPRYIVVENVSALLSRGLGDVLADLAAIGYDAEWHCIPASTVGAPHRRDRIWIIAYPAKERRKEAGKLRCKQLAEWISGCCEAAFPSDYLQERAEGRGTGSISGFSAFSWCKDVRGVEDLRERSDLPEPLFCGSCDGVPNWVDRIGSPGNAVVPQIPEIIGHAILEAEGMR